MRLKTIGKALVLAMSLSSTAALSVAQTPQKLMFKVAGIEPVKANSVRSGGSCHGKDSKVFSEQPFGDRFHDFQFGGVLN